MSVCKNVFEAILKYGHDEDFDPELNDHFLPTMHLQARRKNRDPPSSRRTGPTLWHTDDRVDYAGLTGVIRPRE